MSATAKNIIGETYGRLTVIEDLGMTGNIRNVLCKCECGNIKKTRYFNILYGSTKSCGCIHKEQLAKRNSKPVIIGETFGSLTITENLGVINKRTYVLCKCICGNTIQVVLYSLKSGNTKSCGCRQREEIVKASITHGLKKHPLYAVWTGMKQRCYNEKSHSYKNYGGRGIKVCEEWRNDFKIFFDWCMSNGYERGLEIDRYPNNDGNYEPTNCRFVTPMVNCNNTRKNKLITYADKTKTISEWAREFKIKPAFIYKRLGKKANIEDVFNSLTIQVSS